MDFHDLKTGVGHTVPAGGFNRPLHIVRDQSPEIEVTILMPCLNEAETIGACIGKAKEWIERNDVSAEILVSDNGSTDASKRIAREAGARVIDAPEKGYGAALIFGISRAKGKYIIMGDSDDSY